MPMHFGHGVNAALMNALLAGRSIVCLPEADVPALFGAIEAYRPTYVSASFALFREIARRAPDFPDAVAQSRLRFMRSGSGHLARDDGGPARAAVRRADAQRARHDGVGSHRARSAAAGARKRGAVGLPL